MTESYRCFACGDPTREWTSLQYCRVYCCDRGCEALLIENMETGLMQLDARKSAPRRRSRSRSRSKSRSRSRNKGRSRSSSKSRSRSRSSSRSRSRSRSSSKSGSRSSRSRSKGRSRSSSKSGSRSRSSSSRGRKRSSSSASRKSRSSSSGSRSSSSSKSRRARKAYSKARSRGSSASRKARQKTKKATDSVKKRRSKSRKRKQQKKRDKNNTNSSSSSSDGGGGAQTTTGADDDSGAQRQSRGQKLRKNARRVRSASKEAVRRGRNAARELKGGGSRSSSPGRASVSPPTPQRSGTTATDVTPSPAWISGPGYRGSRDYWTRDDARGYGHSRWFVTRYPWAQTMLPYQQWYIWDSWVPQYTVNASYAVQLERGMPLSGGALVYDRVNFPRDMPAPPTFAERQINIEPLRVRKSEQELGAGERDSIDETLNNINVQLSQLRREENIKRWQSQGYMLVPDLDTQSFTWVKNAAKSDLGSRHRTAK